MAFEIINNGDSAIVNLQSDPKEHIIVDFYRVSKIIQGILCHTNKRCSFNAMSYCFEENEHEIISDYLGNKVTLNDLYIEDIIELEDAIEAYLFNIFCKNVPYY